MSSDARDAGSRDVPGDGWAAGTGGIFLFPRSRGAQVSPRRRGRVRGGAVLAVLLSAGGANAVSVSVGGVHTCAVLNDGKLMCWGRNEKGQLGVGSAGGSTRIPVEIDLGSGRTAKSVSCGTGGTTLAAGAHTCAILDDDTLKCWGLNTQGHLGYGDTTQRNAPETTAVVNLGAGRTAKAVVCGWYHTCAILDDNTLKCWGYNNNGQLGYGDTTTRTAPEATAVVNLGSGRTAKAVSAGYQHTCAILDDDTLKCWGGGTYGQLGQGTLTSFRSPPIPVNLGGVGATSVSASPYHSTCATLDNGKLKCWGYNYQGQVGDGTTTDRNSPVDVDLGTGYTAKMVSMSSNTACAILNDDSIKCWGDNSYGAFGSGNYLASADNLPTSTVLPAGLTAKSVSVRNYAGAWSATSSTVCAVMNDDSIWCWGSSYGVGLGIDTSFPARVCITADDCAAPSGPPGPPGNDGNPGAPGTNGTDAAAGASGASSPGPPGPPGPPGTNGTDAAAGASGASSSSPSPSGNKTVYVYGNKTVYVYVNVSGPPGPPGPPGPGFDAYIDAEGNSVNAADRRVASLPMLALSTILYLLFY